ncbi:MAG TPA: cytochrome c-type biogenesis protein [Vitreimonas sp.]|uniref:cytochrome c-type biogenesis protein n=1 Tax=Vitreimonas sp. TaxID=3069702 RepID=UPI002D666792|nr:cytochrome c-type biogenesis protein [Vitreimonas sp.]HYD89196.1 cytochrome c-type biogenesis protein [Vitreimonas sp.]
MSLLAMLVAAAAPAVLGDPAQEARARALDAEIRCVQCENEPIAQSTADIAVDMRRLVRERIVAGDSDAEIRDYFRQRYGDFVLFRPPWDARTWALWLAPLALLLIGLLTIFAARDRTRAGAGLQPEESER